MKKLSTLAVAAATVLSLTAGGTFAWFTTTKTSQAISVSAATIDVKISNILSNGDLSNRLPGEVIEISDGSSGSGTITNDGSREAIVEINFGDQSYAKLAGADMSKIPAELQGDYEIVNSEVHMKASRFAEVVEISTEAVAPNWLKVGDKYYTRLNANDTTTLGKITMTLLGELGGNKKQSDGTLSADRSFEQGCSFNVGFTAVACQATEEAIADQFGTDIANAIKAHNSGWFN